MDSDDGLTPALKLLAAVLCTTHELERASDAFVAIESTLRVAYLDTPRGADTDHAAREIAAAYWMVRRLRTDLERTASTLKVAHEAMKTDTQRAATSTVDPTNTSTAADIDQVPAPLLH